jgi:hypothetical protein
MTTAGRRLHDATNRSSPKGPRHTVDVGDGVTVIELPLPTARASTLELRGFDQGKLAAARRIQL